SPGCASATSCSARAASQAEARWRPSRPTTRQGRHAPGSVACRRRRRRSAGRPRRRMLEPCPRLPVVPMSAPALAPRSPSLGHGAPTLATSTHPVTDMLRGLGARLPLPPALILVSPHRQAAGFDVGGGARFQAWHDFSGFPRELYELEYAPPGAPALAARVSQALRAAGLPSQVSDDARIDHGIWVPLRMAWPAAQLPVVPIAGPGRRPAA